MKHLQNVSFLWLIIMLAGCESMGTPPADTNEKRLAAAEITWNNTLKTVNANIDRLSVEQAQTLVDTLPKAEEAIKAAHTALSLVDQIDFDTQMGAINSSIKILRALLETLETTELNDGKFKQFERNHVAGFSIGRVRDYRRDWRAIPFGGIGRQECFA